MSRPPAPRGAPPRRYAARRAPRPAAARTRIAILPAFILAAFTAVALALFVGIIGLYAAYTTGLPPVSELENFQLDEGSRVYSADGVELASFAAEQREVVAFKDIPQLLVDAQVAAEDRTFWTNPCIDFKGILRAAYQNLSAGGTVSGASTICQQLVRIRLFDAELMANPDRILERKIKEAILALRVSDQYPGRAGKEQILAMYMNQVYYGNNAYGIKAAARAYFGKDITSSRPNDRLSIGEAAMLVGLVRSPSALDPTKEAVERKDAQGRTRLVVPNSAGAKRVQGFVLANMVRDGYITQDQADEATAERIVLAPQRSRRYRAPHFVYAVRRAANDLLGNEDLLDRGGLRIDTTLQYRDYQVAAEKWAGVAYDLDRLSDARLAAKYGDAALTWIKQLQGRNINNDALVTLNYRTGAVLAYVGSSNYYGRATDAHQPAFDVVGQAYRQSGSAFKPITYATGFERGVITPATMLMDVKGIIADGYSVPNADGGQRGPVRVRDALKYSWNIPVAKVQQLIGTQQVVDMATRLGMRWDPQQEKQGVAVPSLTLGTIGVHQLDLAGAYGAIANGGVLAPSYLIEKITDRDGNVIYDHSQDAPQPKRVLSAQSAYLVTDILADNTDPAQNSIWGQRFQLQTPQGRRPATLKTGTTNDFRDLQAFGYLAPDTDPNDAEGAIVTGVWVGNSDFSPIADVFAADGPTFIWHDYMAEVTEATKMPVRDFPRPDGIVEKRVDAISGMLPGPYTTQTVTEVFAASNVPTQEDTIHQRFRIESATGKIWREGCGDSESSQQGRIYIALGDYEKDHPSWQRADDKWIAQWRGRERQLPRAPAPPLGYPLAPTEKCTPGAVPTSTPSPSPSPTPQATPEPTPEATPEPTATPAPTATPTPAPPNP
jgi:membrane peptidoglycan carboxypeptidase